VTDVSMIDPMTADALRQAVNAAQAGNIPTARKLAEIALADGGDKVALNAFLGMLHARSGEHIAAIHHLKEAHRGRPEDATIACNLIAALLEVGDLVSGLDVATHELAQLDKSLRIARYRGFIAQSLKRFEDAVDAYERVVRHAPEDFESWNNLGNARSANGDLEGSVLALRRAVDLDPAAAPTRLNFAAALDAAGRTDEAESALKAAASDFPRDSRVPHELYVLYKRLGRQDEAFGDLEKAISLDPENANLQLKFGIECGLINRIADAEAAFRKCIMIDPQLVDAYLGLAIQYEHTNREEEFAPLIALAKANGVDEAPLGFLEALEHRRAGRFEEGLNSLSRVPLTIEPERSAHLRATLLDRLNRSDEAFEAFEETNLRHAENSSDPLRRSQEMRSDLRNEIDIISSSWASGWPVVRAAASDQRDPVFLVGFPRSGTTLLDTILMGHPDAIVMEEQPPLNFVERKIGRMDAIPLLDQDAVLSFRSHYFDEVGRVADLRPNGLLIDKSPLYLSKVPLIHRLFPEAKFILALRHPCDVILSCFMSNFRLNSAMSNFLRLQDAAEFYDLTFRHWERSSAVFPLQVHTIVYEQLVKDVEAEVRPLFDFLRLEWREEALDHRKTAKSRGLVPTASYSQITEPIYKRAAGRWERYRAHLEPVFPTLKPWVEKFGYSL
jgi:tetratricopeptide (TPR) repeat protein